MERRRFILENSIFPALHQKVKRLLKVFAEYEFDSVLKACFCVSINRDNRSALENCLSMNETLRQYSVMRNGRKRINNYLEFKEFFSKIERILPTSYMDDYTVPDFGEVRAIFDGIAYKVYIGTGHTQVYPYLASVETVAKALKLENEFRSLLEYQDAVIRYFEKDNICTEALGKVYFKIPEERLFLRTWKFFDEEIDRYDLLKLNNFFPRQEEKIEKQHFLRVNEKVVPLYNTTLILDYMGTKIKLDEKKLACRALYDYLNKVEPFWEIGTCHYLFPATIRIDDLFLEDFRVNVAIASNTGIILCFDSDSWNKNKKRYMEVINGLENKEFELIETRKRNDSCNIGLRLKGKKIKIVIFVPIMNLDDSHQIIVDDTPGVLICTSADLMELLMFSDDENELWDYIDWTTSRKEFEFFNYGVLTSEFFVWKESGRVIEKGAISFNIIDAGYNESIEYIWCYFKEKLHNYPWGAIANPLFANPFAWKIINKESSLWDEYVMKNYGLGGKLINLNGKVLFLCNNVAFYRNEQPGNVKYLIDNVFSLVEDIFMRMTFTCKDLWGNCTELEDKFIELMFMPNAYYKKVSGKIVGYKSVYSDATFHRGAIIIRFTVNDKILYEEIKEAIDRSAECNFYLNLFKPLCQYVPRFYCLMEQQLQSIAHTARHVGVFPLLLPYKWNVLSAAYEVDDVNYHEVRKRIAKVIDDNGVGPGEYVGEKANAIIRTVQKALINDFETRVAVFDKKILHMKLLEIYSSVLHKIVIDKERYSAISDIDDVVKSELYEKIIREREEFKRQKRVVEYLIETNLFLNRESSKECSWHEFQDLLAYSNWLVVLADNADICNFTDAEVHIEVSTEKIVDVIGEAKDNLDDFFVRRYSDKGYFLSAGQQDKKYMKLAKKAFKEDTGIELQLLLDVLMFLAEGNIGAELAPNVFEASESELVSKFLTETGDELNSAAVEKIIDFVAINPNLLKTCKGKADYYLPIGRRKERCNRFEIKGILRSDTNLIYSPVHCNYIRDCWVKGILEFFLPYTIGLDKLEAVLKEWKQIYEKKIVSDIADYFKKHLFCPVRCNLDLKKMDKTDKSLLKLGDYDVLAVDADNKKIWIIECKVLTKVGSFYEMFKQQESFFLKKKEDEHFQTRIDFMKNNYHKVLEYLKCGDKSDYEIMPYMVMNKVMTSRYKKIGFPIISVTELYDEIDKWSKVCE